MDFFGIDPLLDSWNKSLGHEGCLNATLIFFKYFQISVSIFISEIDQ